MSDDFTTVLMMKLLSVGQMNVADILGVQHNEHRSGFPYALTLLLAQFDHYNCVHNMYMGLVFIGATLAIMLCFYWPKFREAGITPFALVPIAWLVCSLRQTQNLLMAFQGAYESVFFFVLCLFILNGVNALNSRIWCAGLCALLSAFSFGSGLLTLPLGFMLLVTKFLLLGREQLWKHRDVLISWIVISLAIGAAYFWHFIPSVGQGKVTIDFLMHSPLKMLAFATGFMASPVAHEEQTAMLMGAVYILLCVICAIALLQKPKAFNANIIIPSMLIGFSIMSSCMATLGRAQLGIEASYVSRYVTVANYGWIGLYLLILFAQDLGQKFRLIMTSIVLACFTFGAVTTALFCQSDGLIYRDFELNAANVIRSFDVAGPKEIVRWLGRHANDYGPLVKFLEQNRLSLFAKEQDYCDPALHSNANPIPYWCVIDFANGRLNNESKDIPTVNLELSKETDLALTGWVANLPDQKLAHAIWLVVDDHLIIPAAYGLTRTAIATNTKMPFLATSGFASSLRTSILAKGWHTLRLKILDRHRGASYLSPVMLKLDVL